MVSIETVSTRDSPRVCEPKPSPCRDGLHPAVGFAASMTSIPIAKTRNTDERCRGIGKRSRNAGLIAEPRAPKCPQLAIDLKSSSVYRFPCGGSRSSLETARTGNGSALFSESPTNWTEQGKCYAVKKD